MEKRVVIKSVFALLFAIAIFVLLNLHGFSGPGGEDAPCPKQKCAFVWGWVGQDDFFTAGKTIGGTAFADIHSWGGGTNPPAATGNTYDKYAWSASETYCPDPVVPYDASPQSGATQTLIAYNCTQHYCP